jgi:hypothetical protein
MSQCRIRDIMIERVYISNATSVQSYAAISDQLSTTHNNGAWPSIRRLTASKLFTHDLKIMATRQRVHPRRVPGQAQVVSTRTTRAGHSIATSRQDPRSGHPQISMLHHLGESGCHNPLRRSYCYAVFPCWRLETWKSGTSCWYRSSNSKTDV